MPTHNQLSLMQPIQAFGGLWPTPLCSVGALRADTQSISFSFRSFSLCHPGLAATQTHIFKLSHHAVPCHALSLATRPWLKTMTSNFPNCQKPSHRPMESNNKIKVLHKITAAASAHRFISHRSSTIDIVCVQLIRWLVVCVCHMDDDGVSFCFNEERTDAWVNQRL